MRFIIFMRRPLGDLPGVEFMPEAEFGDSTRWLTCLLLDPSLSRVTPEELLQRFCGGKYRSSSDVEADAFAAVVSGRASGGRKGFGNDFFSGVFVCRVVRACRKKICNVLRRCFAVRFCRVRSRA